MGQLSAGWPTPGWYYSESPEQLYHECYETAEAAAAAAHAARYEEVEAGFEEPNPTRRYEVVRVERIPANEAARELLGLDRLGDTVREAPGDHLWVVTDPDDWPDLESGDCDRMAAEIAQAVGEILERHLDMPMRIVETRDVEVPDRNGG